MKTQGSVQVGFKSDGSIAIEIVLSEERFLVPISIDEAMCLAAGLNELIVLTSQGLAKDAYELTVNGPNGLN